MTNRSLENPNVQYLLKTVPEHRKWNSTTNLFFLIISDLMTFDILFRIILGPQVVRIMCHIHVSYKKKT